MSSTIKEFYDNLYSKNPNIFGISSLNFLKKIVEFFSPVTGRALDIGVGEGLTSVFLAGLGFQVDAVDISKNAFKANKNSRRIIFHNVSILDFKRAHTDYSLINVALVAHHILVSDFITTVKVLQDSTTDEGLHVLRLFTKNSDFSKESSDSYFFDDGVTLDALYKDWEKVFAEVEISIASTQTAKNEIRSVVFKKRLKVIPQRQRKSV